eukprot:2186447-Pyramimonas_sp.AAC.1
MLRELQRAGVDWEVKQQRELLRTGSRSYPICEAADRHDVSEFLGTIGKFTFEDGHWDLLSKTTEETQLQ